MLLAAAAASAATGCRSATATASASGSGCPRLTGGTVRLEDPILDYRSSDLIAIDGGAGERQEGRELEPPALSIACVPTAAAAGKFSHDRSSANRPNRRRP